METIAEFNDNHGFNVKLTNEKIFIDSAGSSETIALRGLNGVGLYDDLEKYNNELKMNKSNGNGKTVFMVLFLIYAVICIYCEWYIIGLIMGVIAMIPKILFSGKEPILDSYFRLMLSGGDRQFLFNKSDETSVKNS